MWGNYSRYHPARGWGGLLSPFDDDDWFFGPPYHDPGLDSPRRTSIGRRHQHPRQAVAASQQQPQQREHGRGKQQLKADDDTMQASRQQQQQQAAGDAEQHCPTCLCPSETGAMARRDDDLQVGYLNAADPWSMIVEPVSWVMQPLMQTLRQAVPKARMVEDEKAYHLELELPGIPRDKVSVEWRNGNVLAIKGAVEADEWDEQREAQGESTQQDQGQGRQPSQMSEKDADDVPVHKAGSEQHQDQYYKVTQEGKLAPGELGKEHARAQVKELQTQVTLKHQHGQDVKEERQHGQNEEQERQQGQNQKQEHQREQDQKQEHQREQQREPGQDQSVQKQPSGQQEQSQPARQARYVRYFSRSLMFPKGINPDAIRAKYHNGLLSITVPKAKADRCAIRIEEA